MHSTYTGESERAYARQVTYTHAMKCNQTLSNSEEFEKFHKKRKTTIKTKRKNKQTKAPQCKANRRFCDAKEQILKLELIICFEGFLKFIKGNSHADCKSSFSRQKQKGFLQHNYDSFHVTFLQHNEIFDTEIEI